MARAVPVGEVRTLSSLSAENVSAERSTDSDPVSILGENRGYVFSKKQHPSWDVMDFLGVERSAYSEPSVGFGRKPR